ncbi:hypothetical protein [Polaromonas sp.]|uniref:hypothetical protein n=1 Tax=Polaromonas sp. TaxID=1869339 RepID=UPI003BABEEAE
MRLAPVEITNCHSSTVAVRPSTASLARASVPATPTEQQALAFAAQADLSSPWPTHRIRCFLPLQAKATESPGMS